ncbi:hypothetical protein [Bartonella sp. B41]
MPSYLKTIYQGIPLYYAGNSEDTIVLEPQKRNAILFISQKAAECVVQRLAKECFRNDFFVVQQHD